MSRRALSDAYVERSSVRHICPAHSCTTLQCFHVYTFIHSASAFVYIYIHMYIYIYIYTGHNMTQPYSIYTVYDMTQPYFLIPCSAMRTILSLLSGDSRTEDSVGSFLCATAVIKSTQFVKINCKWIFVFTDVSFCWRLYFMLVSYSTLYCSKCTSGK